MNITFFLKILLQYHIITMRRSGHGETTRVWTYTYKNNPSLDFQNKTCIS